MPEPTTAIVGGSALLGAMGQKSTPSTIQSSTSLPGYAQPYHQQALQMMGGLAGQPYTPYPGPQVAGFNPTQEAAMNAGVARGMQGSPVDAAAQQQAIGTLQGDYLNPQTNAPLQGMIDAATKNVMTQYGGALGRNFANSGVQEMVGQGIGNAIAPIYGMERGNQMSAMGMSPGLSQTDYRDIGAVAGVGDARQGLQQQMLDVPAAEFAAARQWPFQTTGALGGLLGLGGMSQTQDNPYVGNPWQSALGGAATGAGLADMFGLFGNSSPYMSGAQANMNAYDNMALLR